MFVRSHKGEEQKGNLQVITLYTSVGRYELRKNENGEKQPIVTVDQKEMALSREELLLWSCLMWGF